jgi:hypothetical protein
MSTETLSFWNWLLVGVSEGSYQSLSCARRGRRGAVDLQLTKSSLRGDGGNHFPVLSAVKVTLAKKAILSKEVTSLGGIAFLAKLLL